MTWVLALVVGLSVMSQVALWPMVYRRQRHAAERNFPVPTVQWADEPSASYPDYRGYV